MLNLMINAMINLMDGLMANVMVYVVVNLMVTSLINLMVKIAMFLKSRNYVISSFNLIETKNRYLQQ